MDSVASLASSSIAIASVSVVLSWLLRGSGKLAPYARGSTVVLRYGTGIWRLALFEAVGMPALLVALWWLTGRHPRPDPLHDAYAFAGLIVAFVVMGGGLLLQCFFTRVVVDDAGVTSTSLLQSTRQAMWNQITTVQFSPTRGELSFTSGRGAPVKVSVLLTGFASLVTALRMHVDERLWREALEDLSRYYEKHR